MGGATAVEAAGAEVGTETAPETAIDVFLREKLRERGLDFAKPAERRAWIRRLTFDLHGLPPTPEEVETYVSRTPIQTPTRNWSIACWRPPVTESGSRVCGWMWPTFGESNGFGMDRPRPTAWPYRDYVIEQFNADVPYARFVREQIAADVLYPRRRNEFPRWDSWRRDRSTKAPLVEQSTARCAKRSR